MPFPDPITEDTVLTTIDDLHSLERDALERLHLLEDIRARKREIEITAIQNLPAAPLTRHTQAHLELHLAHHAEYHELTDLETTTARRLAHLTLEIRRRRRLLTIHTRLLSPPTP